MSQADQDPSTLRAFWTRWGGLIRIAVTLLSIGALALMVDRETLRDLARLLPTIPPTVLVTSLTLSLLASVSYAARWRVLLRGAGATDPPSVPGLLRTTMVTNTVGWALSTSFAADFGQGWLTRRALPGADSWIIVFFGRIYGLVGLATASAVGWLLLPSTDSRLGVSFLGAGLLGCLLVAALPWISTRLGPRLPELLQRLSFVDRAFHAHRRILSLLGLSTLIQFLAGLRFLVVLVPLCPEVPLGDALGLVLFAQIAGLVPSVLGLGPGQIAQVVLLGLIGVPEGAVLSMAMAVWGLGLIEAAIGGILILLGRGAATEAATTEAES